MVIGQIVTNLVVVCATLQLAAVPAIAAEQVSGRQEEAPFSQGQRALGVQNEQYGILAAVDPMARHVDEIFTKLLRVSGRRPGAVFEAYVLDTPKIIVQALPGGRVVISRGAVDLAGHDDGALAFLLAHEVAHVVRDHHGLLSSFQRVGVAQPSPPDFSTASEKGRTLQALELEADRLGLLYTSLAGYRARAAAPILRKVIALTGSSAFHPEPKDRAATIEAAVRQIGAHVELFSLGLVYLASGRCEEAARMYETFATLYPSREVYNNLGVAYHRWALVYQRDDGWRRSIMADPQTRARGTLKDIGGTVPDAEGAKHPLFARYMERAITAYRLSVESDPDYALGHNNLGLAYLEVGEHDYAVGEFKRAIRIDEKLATVWNNRGVAYAKTGEADRARADFQQAALINPNYPDPHGNLARLYELGQNASLAAAERQRFDQLSVTRRSRESRPSKESVGGVKAGVEVPNIETSASAVFTVPLGLREEDALRVIVNDQIGALVAARGGKVDIVAALEAYRGKTALGVGVGTSAGRLQGVYGLPLWREESQSAQLWSYPDRGLAFFIVGDRVSSWWAWTQTEAIRR